MMSLVFAMRKMRVSKWTYKYIRMLAFLQILASEKAYSLAFSSKNYAITPKYKKKADIIRPIKKEFQNY